MYPYINSVIVEVSNSGNVLALLQIVAQYMPDMNLVNLTTSLHRIAKLCSECSSVKVHLRQEGHQQILQSLLSALSSALLRGDGGNNESRRQSLSNIIWSLGILRCVQMQLVEVATMLAQAQLTLFKPFELVSTVWAFAKLGALHPGVREIVAPLQQAAVYPILAIVSKLGFRNLAMVAWAMAASSQCNPQLFSKLESRIARVLSGADATPEMLIDVAWAFSSAGWRSEQVMAQVAFAACDSGSRFDNYQLSQLRQILALEAIRCPRLFDGAQATSPTPAPTVLSLTRSLQAESQAAPCSSRFCMVEDDTKVEVQRCTASTAGCDDDAYTLEVDWEDFGEAKAHDAYSEHSTASFDEDGRMPSAEPSNYDFVAGESPLTCKVKNTFWELGYEEVTEEEVAIKKRLSAPMNIAVGSMPRDELDATRVRYQLTRTW